MVKNCIVSVNNLLRAVHKIVWESNQCLLAEIWVGCSGGRERMEKLV